MVQIFEDGFDHYGSTANMLLGAYAQATCDFNTNPALARTGSGSIRLSSSGNNSRRIRAILPVTSFTLGVGAGHSMSMAPPSAVTAKVGFGFARGGADGDWLMSAYVNENLGITVCRGWYRSPEAILGSSPNGLVQLGTYNWIEMRSFMSNTNGTVEVRVNSSAPYLITGVDTLAGATGANNFIFNKTGEGSSGWGTGTYDLDDLVVWDTTGAVNNDFYGPNTRNYTRFMVSDGVDQDWTPNTGAAYAALAHVPPDMATWYVEGNNIGDVSNFGLTPLPTNIAFGRSQTLVGFVQKTDASATLISPQLDVSGTLVTGTDLSPPQASPNFMPTRFQLDPLTSSYWSLADMQATTAQIERVA